MGFGETVYVFVFRTSFSIHAEKVNFEVFGPFVHSNYHFEPKKVLILFTVKNVMF